MTEKQQVAFVTGASRGIGKVCAIALAEAGFDVAITARTVQEGEAREHSSTVAASDTSPLPGSLTGTADLIRAAGRDALVVPADLNDRASLGAAAATVLERWGRVDVIVHNARYIGPGHMDRFLDTPIELLEKHLEANVIAPLVLNQYLLPGMVKRGHRHDHRHHVGVGLRRSHQARGRRRVGPRLRHVEGRVPPRRGRARGRARRRRASGASTCSPA